MMIERVIGNVRETVNLPRHIERVYLRSELLLKRIQRVRTDHGNELGIRLKNGVELRDGDILYQDEKNAIVISVLEDEVIAIKPTTLKQMGEIGHMLGNRHLPAQFTDEEMVVQYDYLVEKLLQELDVPYVCEKRKLAQAFKHIGHSHG
ncbi:urease accessory protein UreE [Bacillus sp. DNRA2]|uniref:urease accessory protein UreE n=1 Tax=Bacillus sp. DNRA2 TaxID=2723053 RepID=UPI00145D9325|nr:urease accessory protein UreE [Bacillus sp. DNRA2]NMD71790.1 urease accessory protein UreE [Bacillus sp. DNRA2]